LLALRREVMRVGGTWCWQGANEALRDLAALYGVGELLDHSGP
jgi:ABC-type transporter Mla MlaB component